MPELPKPLAQPAKEPVIYTIPEQFYGMAAKALLPKATPATPSPASVVPGGGVPAPAMPSAQGGQSRKWLLIPVFAVLVLIGLGFAAWWFLQPKAPATRVSPSPSPIPSAPESPPPAQPQPAPQPEPQPATTTVETPPAPEADGDNDGLTNAEETLYGTDPNLADSDADGFSDSVEVINLYNPAGFKPTKLIEAGLVKPDTDALGGQVLYPSVWTRQSGADGVRYLAADGQGVSLQAEDNPSGQSALDWYLTKNPSASASQVQAFVTKSGLEGVRSPDGGSAYVSMGGKIYVFAKIVGNAPAGAGKDYYASTFLMMTNSFSQKP